jgi:hypothetical protein
MIATQSHSADTPAEPRFGSDERDAVVSSCIESRQDLPTVVIAATLTEIGRSIDIDLEDAYARQAAASGCPIQPFGATSRGWKRGFLA